MSTEQKDFISDSIEKSLQDPQLQKTAEVQETPAETLARVHGEIQTMLQTPQSEPNEELFNKLKNLYKQLPDIPKEEAINNKEVAIGIELVKEMSQEYAKKGNLDKEVNITDTTKVLFKDLYQYYLDNTESIEAYRKGKNEEILENSIEAITTETLKIAIESSCYPNPITSSDNVLKFNCIVSDYIGPPKGTTITEAISVKNPFDTDRNEFKKTLDSNSTGGIILTMPPYCNRALAGELDAILESRTDLQQLKEGKINNAIQELKNIIIEKTELIDNTGKVVAQSKGGSNTTIDDVNDPSNLYHDGDSGINIMLPQNLPTGIYVYRIRTPNEKLNQKLIGKVSVNK